jgi:hypothetical protein
MYKNPEKAHRLSATLHATEQKKFLEQLPVHWKELDAEECVDPEALTSIRNCYIAALNSTLPEIRRECATRLMEVVKSESKYYADRYVDAFFAAILLSNLTPEFKIYVLDRVKRQQDRDSLTLLAFEAPYLTEPELGGVVKEVLPMALQSETSDLFPKMYSNLLAPVQKCLDVSFEKASKHVPDPDFPFDDIDAEHALKYKAIHDKCKAVKVGKPN